ncbi:thioesterase family protein [Oceanobacter sp. 4_MG-2023]|uniref:acyl-CoA thioesterase n=1 Tax=Oceanobacter sp. 4_MG-2023 TaxID=3062623 RepID=UPI0027333331|nr:thioesterase family protein [Oceanobacter sp. 4_MG-2023]MDP2546311.1 thioesterase family protein [Oceanobacter sp. 4_MG-2023]
MARVTLALPSTIDFSVDLDVRISEINYGNHLGNDRMVTLLHEARLRYLRSLDFSELDIDGLGIMVADLVVSFRAEAFIGEVLTFAVGVMDFNKYGCDVIYRVSNQSSGKLVAEAKTGIVFFDYTERKLARVPEIFRQHCQGKSAD